MGISNLTYILVSIERLPVYGHIKKGKFVPTHMHLNFTYLLEVDPEEKPRMKADENSGAQWFTVEEALEKSSEAWVRDNIYRKLVAKLK